MKKLYIFLFAFILTAQATFADSELFLKINRQGKFQVFLNNESVTSKKNIFRFFDLAPGNYQVKIVQKNGWSQQIVYEENIQLQNGFRYVAELSNNTGLQKIAQIPYIEKNWYIDQLSTQGNWQNNHVCTPSCNQNNCNQGNWNNNPNNNNNCNNDNHNSWNNNNNYGYNNQYMNDNTFNSVMNAIKNASFDNVRMEIAETALMNSYVKTSQVKQILQQLSFESSRLQLAKYCYKKTTDKQNYFDIYNLFSFSSSINELNAYIKNN